MPDSDRCRWRPGLSSFQTFMVADLSLSRDEPLLVLFADVFLSKVGGVSDDPMFRIGMRLM